MQEILYEDSVLNNLMPKRQDKYFRSNDLKDWTVNPKKSMWRSIKYRAHNDDFSEILWPERYDAAYFKMRQQEFSEQGMSDVYSQEYLNEPIDESVALVKRADLLERTEEDKGLRLRYYITADLAVSEKQRADYSVFVVAGLDEDRRIHIVDVIRDRLDPLEIVELIFELDSVYDPEAIGMEKMMITQTLGPFLREEMRRRNQYPSMVQLTHEGKDKV